MIYFISLKTLIKISNFKQIIIMKNILSIVAVMCFTAAVAQNGGSMEFKYTSSKGASGTMLMKHSEFGSKMEMNMASPKAPGSGIKMTSLVKKDAPDFIYMINDANKSYSEMKKGTAGAGQEDKHTYTVKKIGNETINNYKCIHFTVTNEKGQVSDMWTSKDILDYNKYSEVFKNDNKFGSSKQDNAIKAAGCEGFPVKMMHKNKDQEGDVTMELVKFEKKSYSKSDFDIPAGYTKSAGGPMGVPAMQGMKTQEEIMKMTPDERAKYIEEMKKMYGK